MQHHTHAPPGVPAGVPTLAPDPWALGIPPSYRAALVRLQEVRGIMEQAVADAIDQLDLLDLQIEDLEPEHDAGIDDDQGMDEDTDLEPVLGAPERHPILTIMLGAGEYRDPEPRSDQRAWAIGGDASEREAEDEHGSDLDAGEVDDSDREPSLGSVGAGSPSTMSQTAWAIGAQDDREEENEHGGDVQDEPHDPEVDGCVGDDMEPGGDIGGGTYRAHYRPSGHGVIGANDVGAGVPGFARYGGQSAS